MSILNLLDRPIAYHRPFAAISGSICGGIFLSQAFYWSQRTSDPDGWFWKTQEQWFDETFMTRYEQETARKKLVAIGVLEQKKQGMPAKLFYRIDRKALEVKMQKYAGIQHTGVMESSKQACGNPANKRDGIQHTSVMESNIHECGKPPYILYTETTPETTPEITDREEEARDRETLSELEEKSIQDQPIADQSASLSIKQRDSANDGEISGETVFAAAPIFPPQKNNATANYEKRFASPHKYPELKEAGHADIMIGTGYLDFDPIVVEAAVRHLKKHEKPCEVGDAKRFISNRIKQSDWAAIELLKEAAATIAHDRKKTEAAIAASTNSDEYYDTSRYCVPEPLVIDLEARAKATEGGRAKMREILAVAKKKRAS